MSREQLDNFVAIYEEIQNNHTIFESLPKIKSSDIKDILIQTEKTLIVCEKLEGVHIFADGGRFFLEEDEENEDFFSDVQETIFKLLPQTKVEEFGYFTRFGMDTSFSDLKLPKTVKLLGLEHLEEIKKSIYKHIDILFVILLKEENETLPDPKTIKLLYVEEPDSEDLDTELMEKYGDKYIFSVESNSEKSEEDEH